MIGVIGKKLGMTRIFLEDRGATPVTVVQAYPATVIRAKTVESDGYEAVVVGADPTDKPSKMKSPQKGEFKKYETPYFRNVREFRTENQEAPAVGSAIRADWFKVGDKVDVIGTSKGRGFQGVIKRHGFSGGRATHGSGFHRQQGSIGMHTDPGKVLKGKKFPGHMGDVRRTVLNLEVVAVRPEEDILLIKGSVPGSINGWITVRPAVKQPKGGA